MMITEPMNKREPWPIDLTNKLILTPEPLWSFRIYNITHPCCDFFKDLPSLQKKIGDVLNDE